MDRDSEAAFDGLPNRLYASGNQKSLGAVYDQHFYAVRHEAGETIAFPFPQKHFNALIAFHRATNVEERRVIAMELLEYGMRFALCYGQGADEMAELIDELVDEYNYMHNGCTVFSTVHEDGDIGDALAYFVLPNGLADTGLILSLGDDGDFDQWTETFDSLIHGEGAEIEEEDEMPIVGAPEMACV